MNFAGRVAVVTGGGRGIGRAHARLLASRECSLVIADAGVTMQGEGTEEDPAGEVAEEINRSGGIALAMKCDVLAEAERVVECALERFGRLDILINNAGPIGSFALFAESAVEAWQRVAQVHYAGTVAMCRAAWPALAASDAGRIVNTASTAILGSERQTDYGSAKAAVFGLTRSLAIEGRSAGINVNCVLPSAYSRMMETIPSEALRARVAGLMEPEHVAAFVAWLVHPSTPVNGEAFNVGGGRAVRVRLAAGPSVILTDSTPEGWSAKAAALFAEGPLSPMTTMLENFSIELAEIDPGIEPLLGDYRDNGLELRHS